jgi:preprotein translocase subunit SecG
MWETIFTVIHVITCVALILVILLQSGKGGGVSAAFGGGAGAALGQRSAGTVLSKFTAIAAGVFMVTSMALAMFSTPSARDRTLDDVNLPEKTAPATGATGTKTEGAPGSVPVVPEKAAESTGSSASTTDQPKPADAPAVDDVEAPAKTEDPIKPTEEAPEPAGE